VQIKPVHKCNPQRKITGKCDYNMRTMVLVATVSTYAFICGYDGGRKGE
jgi:hypothetical protein